MGIGRPKPSKVTHKLHCMVCGQTFPSVRKLSKHRRKAHGMPR